MCIFIGLVTDSILQCNTSAALLFFYVSGVNNSSFYFYYSDYSNSIACTVHMWYRCILGWLVSCYFKIWCIFVKIMLFFPKMPSNFTRTCKCHLAHLTRNKFLWNEIFLCIFCQEIANNLIIHLMNFFYRILFQN